MSKKRIQLTLFVEKDESAAIEQIREKFNPEQYKLIKSHVTLCREDELVPLEKVMQNLENLHYPCFTIEFGPIIRFSEAKGILLPASSGYEQFQTLRTLILKGIVNHPTKTEPHITLMHPRNSTCTHDIFNHIAQIKIPGKFLFKKISMIEQEENNKWEIFNEYKLIDRL